MLTSIAYTGLSPVSFPSIPPLRWIHTNPNYLRITAAADILWILVAQAVWNIAATNITVRLPTDTKEEKTSSSIVGKYTALQNWYVGVRHTSLFVSSAALNSCFLFAGKWVSTGFCQKFNFLIDNTTPVIIRKHSRYRYQWELSSLVRYPTKPTLTYEIRVPQVLRRCSLKPPLVSMSGRCPTEGALSQSNCYD